MAKQVDKIKLIRSILDGSFNLDSIREPQSYHAISHGDKSTVTVNGVGKTEFHQVFTADDYKQWVESLRECDVVFHLIFSRMDTDREAYEAENAPKTAIEPITAPIESAPSQYTDNNTQRRKRAVKASNSTLQEDTNTNTEQESILIAVPVKKNYGLASEYGITWGVNLS